MKKIISARKFKEALQNTRTFVVVAGSDKSCWNNIILELFNKADDSFFLNTVNEYGVDCGWYLKYEDIKPLIEKLKINISKQHISYIPYMMYNYNKIIEFLKSEIDYDLELLKQCNIDCIFNKENLCCHAEQEEISPNKSDCNKFKISDYYEQLKEARKLAEDKIRTMDLEELLQLINIFN